MLPTKAFHKLGGIDGRRSDAFKLIITTNKMNIILFDLTYSMEPNL